MLCLKPVPFTDSSAMDNWVFKANVSRQLKKPILSLYSLKGLRSIQAHIQPRGVGERNTWFPARNPCEHALLSLVTPMGHRGICPAQRRRPSDFANMCLHNELWSGYTQDSRLIPDNLDLAPAKYLENRRLQRVKRERRRETSKKGSADETAHLHQMIYCCRRVAPPWPIMFSHISVTFEENKISLVGLQYIWGWSPNVTHLICNPNDSNDTIHWLIILLQSKKRQLLYIPL